MSTAGLPLFTDALPAKFKSWSIQAALVLAASSLAAVLVLAIFLSNKTIAISVLGAMAFIILFVLGGNPRLFCLWGLLLTAPIDPAMHFKILGHMGGASAYTVDGIDFFILGLVFFQLRDHARRYRVGWRVSPVAFYWGILILLGLCDAVTGPYHTSALQEVFRMSKCLLMCIVLINEVVRVRQFYHVFVALLLGAGIEALLGLIQYFTDKNLGLQFLGEAKPEYVKMLSDATLKGGAWVYRVGALLGHANLLAAYLSMLLPIGIALLFARIRLVYKFLCTIVLLLGVAVMIATLSRAGWITFGTAFVGVLTLTFLHPRMRNRYVLLRISVVASLVLVCLALSGPIMGRLERSDPNAVLVRWEYLGIAWKMIQTKPLLGFGLNSYVFNMAPYSKYGTSAGLTKAFGIDWPVVHNIYALTWVEQGTVGFIVFVMMQIYVLIVAFRNLRVKNDVLYAIGMGSLCGFVSILMDGLASFTIRVPGTSRVYWILISIILAIDYWRRANAPSPDALEPSKEELVQTEKATVQPA